MRFTFREGHCLSLFLSDTFVEGPLAFFFHFIRYLGLLRFLLYFFLDEGWFYCCLYLTIYNTKFGLKRAQHEDQ